MQRRVYRRTVDREEEKKTDQEAELKQVKVDLVQNKENQKISKKKNGENRDMSKKIEKTGKVSS